MSFSSAHKKGEKAMRKILAIIGILLVIGMIKNPKSVYFGTEKEMIAIDADHLQDENGIIYTVDRELFTGEKYLVKVEIHSDRTIISDFEKSTERG